MPKTNKTMAVAGVRVREDCEMGSKQEWDVGEAGVLC